MSRGCRFCLDCVNGFHIYYIQFFLGMEGVKLEKASWELVDKILEILHRDHPNSVHAYNILKTHRILKTKVATTEDISLLTPGGAVDEFGSFVLLTKFDIFTVFFYSFHPDINRIITLLKNCEYINWKQILQFGPISEKHYSAVQELIKQNNMKVLIFEKAITYWCDQQSGKDLSYQVPPEVYLAPVTQDHAELINSLWPHRNETSITFVKKLINILGGIGLFLKENNELIAWSLHREFGGPGLLQTVEKQKRKGYATIVAIAMTKYYIDKGEYSVLFVMEYNTNSKQLFAKLPYKAVGNVNWCVLIPA